MARHSFEGLLPLAAIAVALGIAAAPAAQASTLRLSTDRATYFPHGVFNGEVIELRVIADSEGGPDPNGEVFVVIEHNPNHVVPLGASGPADLFSRSSGSETYLRGDAEGTCAWEAGRDNQCLAFQQSLPMPVADTDPGVVIATLLYATTNPGIPGFVVRTAAGGDFVFFDLGGPDDSGEVLAGVNVFIGPEPGTAGMLGLGLVGLAAQRRHARRAAS